MFGGPTCSSSQGGDLFLQGGILFLQRGNLRLLRDGLSFELLGVVFFRRVLERRDRDLTSTMMVPDSVSRYLSTSENCSEVSTVIMARTTSTIELHLSPRSAIFCRMR